MITHKEIRDLEEKVDAMKEQYMKERKPCMNDRCTFYNAQSQINHCLYTIFHDLCEKYKK